MPARKCRRTPRKSRDSAVARCRIRERGTEQARQNPQSAIRNPQSGKSSIDNLNQQSTISINNRQSENPQSKVRNRQSALSQTPTLERCIKVSTSGLVATYPSTYTAPEAVETLTPTVSSLFDLHAPGLYRLAVAMLHDPDAAQDVVQDTFTRLIEQLRGYGPLANPRGWLYTVAAHACRDRQRRSGRWLPWIVERDRRSAPETPDRFDDTQALLHAIRTLSARDRLLIALRAQGLSYQEIGDASGIRHTSVGRLLTRALDRLQKELNRRR